MLLSSIEFTRCVSLWFMKYACLFLHLVTMMPMISTNSNPAINTAITPPTTDPGPEVVFGSLPLLPEVVSWLLPLVVGDKVIHSSVLN